MIENTRKIGRNRDRRERERVKAANPAIRSTEDICRYNAEGSGGELPVEVVRQEK